MSPAVGRTLTIVAVAFLAFDGAALVFLGFMTGRTMLIPIGLVFFLSSGMIVLYWRWHRRRSRKSQWHGAGWRRKRERCSGC